jgi:hypothetical protein
VNIVLGVGLALQKFGKFLFVLRIDNHQLDTYGITATKSPPVTPAK